MVERGSWSGAGEWEFDVAFALACTLECLGAFVHIGEGRLGKGLSRLILFLFFSLGRASQVLIHLLAWTTPVQ